MKDEGLGKVILEMVDNSSKTLRIIEHLCDQIGALSRVTLMLNDRVLKLETRNALIDKELQELIDSR